MCSRFDQSGHIENLARQFAVSIKGKYPKYNIGIGDMAAYIRQEARQQPVIDEAKFGVVTNYGVLYNARIEGDLNPDNNRNYEGPAGIFLKPAFGRLIKTQRCVIPVSGFYEGPENMGIREPYRIALPDEEYFFMGGIYQTYKHPKKDLTETAFTILTTPAQDVTAGIGHHRCPLFIHSDFLADWLNKETGMEVIEKILQNRWCPVGFAVSRIVPSAMKRRNSAEPLPVVVQ